MVGGKNWPGSCIYVPDPALAGAYKSQLRSHPGEVSWGNSPTTWLDSNPGHRENHDNTVWPWSALTGGFFSCWCLWSRKYAQMCTRNMTTCSSRPADHIECLIRGQKAEEVGASSWLSFTTCPWVCWYTKVYQPWYNKADNTPKTIKIIQVTPLEHSFPHQSLKGCVKGLSPIPGCWCSLTARSVPVLFPAL